MSNIYIKKTFLPCVLSRYLTCFQKEGVVYVIPDERNSQETNKEFGIGKRRFIREHNNNIEVHNNWRR